MPSGLTGGDSFHLIKRVLDLRQASHERIAENVAHQDTPGYKAKRLDFQGALKQAISGNRLRQSVTQQGHLGGNGAAAIQQVHATEQVVTKGASQDGNTVNPEQEMATMAENSMMYDVASQIIASKYRGLRGIIREGR